MRFVFAAGTFLRSQKVLSSLLFSSQASFPTFSSPLSTLRFHSVVVAPPSQQYSQRRFSSSNSFTKTITTTTTTSAAMDSKQNIKQDDVEYLQKHQVPQLLNNILNDMLLHRPGEPTVFIKDQLLKKQMELLGIHVPTILLPKAGTDLTKWAVIACDQYTSQPEYWEDVKSMIQNQPSTLRIILPEVYLETEKEEGLIASAKQTMKAYLEGETKATTTTTTTTFPPLLVPQNPGFLLVDRKTCKVSSRKGLVVALDLEQYDYSVGSRTPIRATEGTIVARLPPRLRVREGALVESPHIMVLIDDPEQTVIEPLFSEKQLKKVYDFELMKNGGHLTGYLVDEPKLLEQVVMALTALVDPESYRKKYALSPASASTSSSAQQQQDVLLFAMGDGNHSFATAKLHWENVKQKLASTPEALVNHPARYALVELINIHDKGLEFEPIHRVLFGATLDNLVAEAELFFRPAKAKVTLTKANSLFEAKSLGSQLSAKNVHTVPLVYPEGYGVLAIEGVTHNLVLGSLQPFLDHYLKQESPKIKIDYVHGDEAVSELGKKPNNLGLFCPPIDKFTFFRSIIMDGTLPRKTFSMGEADEKRFYMECRRIVP